MWRKVIPYQEQTQIKLLDLRNCKITNNSIYKVDWPNETKLLSNNNEISDGGVKKDTAKAVEVVGLFMVMYKDINIKNTKSQ